MTKKEKIIDNLRNIVIDRAIAQGITLTPNDANTIWYALLGEYDLNGYESAVKVAQSKPIRALEG